MEVMGMHVVLIGDPINGMEVFGPFKTGIDAEKWASAYAIDSWVIAPLKAQSVQEERAS